MKHFALASTALLFSVLQTVTSFTSYAVPHFNTINDNKAIQKSPSEIYSALSIPAPLNFEDDQSSWRKKRVWTIEGPSLDTKPDYNTIHGPLGKFVDYLFVRYFRKKMAEKMGIDSKLPQGDFAGIMELTAALNARYSDRREVQKISLDILHSLFPAWLTRIYIVLFAKPFPRFSARMNARMAKVVGVWLMGESEVNDCEIDDGTIGINQGLLVKRCRYLEESKCASACVNSCKIPTQKFFMEEMGLPLTMEPNYETGECQFKFGKSPDSQEEFDAKNTPCFSRCPSSGTLRTWHSKKSSEVASTQQCGLMD
jgi:hypothetical protein